MQSTHIAITCRLIGGVKAYEHLSGLPGTNSYLWNQAIAKSRKEYKNTGRTNSSYFTLGKWYMQNIIKSPIMGNKSPWLYSYPAWNTKLDLQNIARAYKRFYDNHLALLKNNNLKKMCHEK